MKKIWIDGYEANAPQRLGSGQLAWELLKHIEKLDQKNSYRILLPGPAREDLPKERKNWEYQVLSPSKFWTKIALPLALFRASEKPDVFYSPTHYIPQWSPVKRVANIYDLAFLKFEKMYKASDMWQLKNGTKYTAKHADHLITISNATRKDIENFYQVEREKITVAYPGYEDELFFPNPDDQDKKSVLEKFGITQKYVAYIATIQPRKNHLRLINAFQSIPHAQLVLIGKSKGQGKQGWMFEEILERPKQLGIEGKVIFTGFVTDQEKATLVRNATGYIQPSLYEGFGIPVVDAMAAGVPVIASNTASLPEAVEDAGILVDPYSEEELEQAMRLILSNKRLQSELSAKSLKQAKKFSWDKMAKQVIEVLENV